MRALIDVPKDSLDSFDLVCNAQNISRAEGVRRAINHYMKYTEKPTNLDESFGLWSKRKVDALTYQQKLRADW